MAFLHARLIGQDLWPSEAAANALLQGVSMVPNRSSEITVHLVALIKFSWYEEVSIEFARSYSIE
jgi:hypothetical protein